MSHRTANGFTVNTNQGAEDERTCSAPGEVVDTSILANLSTTSEVFYVTGHSARRRVAVNTGPDYGRFGGWRESFPEIRANKWSPLLPRRCRSCAIVTWLKGFGCGGWYTAASDCKAPRNEMLLYEEWTPENRGTEYASSMLEQRPATLADCWVHTLLISYRNVCI